MPGARITASKCLCGLLILAVLASLSIPAWGTDAIVEAKRRAANELLRTNRTADGITLLREVIAQDDKNFRDHLALARAYDKLNRSSDAVESYRQVLALIPVSSTNAEERGARSEADRRLKVLDLQPAKVNAFIDETLKKLEVLEKEAESTKNAAATDRIWHLRAGIFQAAGRSGVGGAIVQATAEWQSSGFRVVKGETYRIVAHGTWRMGKGVDTECTGAGLVNLPLREHGPRGLLMATIDFKAPFIQVGTGTEFVATADGTLAFIANETFQEKADNSGSIAVIIMRQ